MILLVLLRSKSLGLQHQRLVTWNDSQQAALVPALLRMASAAPFLVKGVNLGTFRDAEIPTIPMLNVFWTLNRTHDRAIFHGHLSTPDDPGRRLLVSHLLVSVTGCQRYTNQPS